MPALAHPEVLEEDRSEPVDHALLQADRARLAAVHDRLQRRHRELRSHVVGQQEHLPEHRRDHDRRRHAAREVADGGRRVPAVHHEQRRAGGQRRDRERERRSVEQPRHHEVGPVARDAQRGGERRRSARNASVNGCGARRLEPHALRPAGRARRVRHLPAAAVVGERCVVLAREPGRRGRLRSRRPRDRASAAASRAAGMSVTTARESASLRRYAISAVVQPVFTGVTTMPARWLPMIATRNSTWLRATTDDVVAGHEAARLEPAAELNGLALEVGPGEGAADVGDRDVGRLAVGRGSRAGRRYPRRWKWRQSLGPSVGNPAAAASTTVSPKKSAP